MSDEIALVDEFDDTQTGDLLREKDEIRQGAAGRDRLRLARERAAQRASAAPAEGGTAPGASASSEGAQAPSTKTEDPRGFFRHISPVEATGGVLEGLTDLIDTVDDASEFVGRGVGSALGMSTEQMDTAIADIETSRGGQFGGLSEVVRQMEVGDPESGSMIREVANFATLFVGAGKIKGLKALAETGRAGFLTSAAVRGGIADFIQSDPEDPRLVDLAEGTVADNPVFDLLQTEEGESALERRLSHAAEGMGIGLAFDTAVIPMLKLAGKGVRALRHAKKGADVLEEIEGGITLQRDEIAKIFGDPDAPLVSVADDAAESAARSASDVSESAPFKARVYHGTDQDPFVSPDPSKYGSGTDEGLLGEGFYTSTDVAVGKNRKHQLQFDVELQNPLYVEWNNWRTPKSKVVSDALGLDETLRGRALSDELRRRGFDGVVLDSTPVGYNHQEVMSLDPMAVRRAYGAKPTATESAARSAAEPVGLFHGSSSELTELNPGSMVTNDPLWAAGYGTQIDALGTESLTGKIHQVDWTPSNPKRIVGNVQSAERWLIATADNIAGNVNGSLTDAARLVHESTGFDAILADSGEMIPLVPIPVRNVIDPADIVSGAVASGRDVPENLVEALSRHTADLGDVDSALAKSGGEFAGAKINFNRINSATDVKQAIAELADSFSDSIGKAQRGVRTHAQTQLAAKEVDAFDVLMSTGQERGVTLNAEESLAMRELWVASARKVKEMAGRITAGVSSPIEELAFRRQMAVHSAIQERVLAVRTETARALNQWRIPAGDNLEFLAQFDQMAAQANATHGSIKKLAHVIDLASKEGNIEAIEQIVYGSRWAKAGDAASSLYYFSMLSGPHTHMRNMLSNTLMMGVSASERKLANLIGRSFGDEFVVTGETTAALKGIIDGSRDAFRLSAAGRRALKMAKEARKAGRPDDVRQILEEAGDDVGTFHAARVSGESGFGVNKVETSPISAFSPEKWGLEKGRNPIGDMFYHTARFFDAVTTMPTRALSAGDEIAKTINARMELDAQAYRQAVADVAAGSADSVDDQWMKLVMSPDESMQVLARETAERNTFTNAPLDSASWQALSRLSRIPVIGTLLVPFVRTPYNLATQSFRRSPLAVFSRSWRDDLMAGGARSDIALAQFAGGTAAMMTFADLTLTGKITGGGPPRPGERAALKRTGWQPYSVRIGDRYFSYRGLEPISTLIGLSADVMELTAHTDWQDPDEELDNVVIAAFFATIANMQNKTYLQGLTNFFDAANDPLRYGENWTERTAGVVMPAVGAHLNRAAFDDYAREVNGMVEAVKARTPGLSSDLPARRDVWGRPIQFGSDLGGLYDFISPLYASKFDPEPIDLKLQEFETWLSKPQRKTKIGGEKVNLNNFPRAYDDLVRLSGNDLTHDAVGVPLDMSRKGLKDALNMLVTGQHPLSSVYQMQGPGGREEMILDMQRRYRNAAKDKILELHPELAELVGQKKETRRAEEMQSLRQFGQ